MSEPLAQSAPEATATEAPVTTGAPAAENGVLPPDPRWAEDKAALHSRLEALDAEVARALERWLKRLKTTQMQPFRQTLQRAARVHEKLFEEAGLAGESPATQQAAWQQLHRYREATARRVLKPIEAQVRKLDLGTSVGEAFGGLIKDWSALVGDAPAHVVLAEPADLYHRAPFDTAAQRRVKWRIRQARRVERFGNILANGVRGLFKKPKVLLAARAHTVPVRQLLVFHLEDRLPTLLFPLAERFQQQLAQQVAVLEEALTFWAHELVQEEADLDRAVYHVAVSLPWASRADAKPEEPISQAAWDEVAAIGEGLQKILEQVAVALDALAVGGLWLDAAGQVLRNDIGYGGTPLLPARSRLLRPAEAQAETRLQVRTKRWGGWHRQVADQLTLNVHLHAIRSQLVDLEEAFFEHIAAEALQPLFDTFGAIAAELRQTQGEVKTACEGALQKMDLVLLTEKLQAIQTQVNADLQAAVQDLPGLVSANEVLTEPGSAAYHEVRKSVQALPSLLNVHVPEAELGRQVLPEQHYTQVTLRTTAEAIFAEPFPEQLRPFAEPLRQRIAQDWLHTEQVQHVVLFNFGAAFEELENPHAPKVGEDEEAPTDTPEEAAVKAAKELAADGLGRSAHALDDLVLSLQEPWEAFVKDSFLVFHGDWVALHQHIRSDVLTQEQWADLQLRVQRFAAVQWRAAKNRTATAYQASRKLLRFGQRQAQEFIKKGQAAVGVLEAGEEARLRTLDIIANWQAVHKKLPLVYRKLFAFEPVAEAALLDGRDRDLDWVSHHYERWRTGKQAGVLILTAPPGSGRTSLLNALQSKVMRELQLGRVSLQESVAGEADLARILADALGLALPENGTLRRLEWMIRQRKATDTPLACFIDNFELLILRCPGGMELAERMLIFLARTDTNVYWVSTMNQHAWHYLQKTATAASGFVTPYRLRTIERNALQSIILNRHRRSGLVLEFMPPDDLSALVRSRYRRAKTEADRQTLLRDLYFDQLYRLCGDNIMLGLYYWIRSCDFETKPETLCIQPIQPLSFDFLNNFDLTRAFTLKAFVVHSTLTLEEHNRIFRMTSDESTFILESLLNYQMIEPLQREDGSELEDATPRLGSRYRIHPLMLYPIANFLKTKHIIY